MNTLTESRFFSAIIALGIALITTLAITEIQTNPLIETKSLRFFATAAVIFIALMLATLRTHKVGAISAEGAALQPQDPQPVRETGHVKWFNAEKGFGFIVRENGEDLFVHFRAVGDGSTLHLIEGQQVEYHIGQGRKGPQAEQVVILE